MGIGDEALVETLGRLERAIDRGEDAPIAEGLAALGGLAPDRRRMAATRVWPDLGEPFHTVGPLLHTAAFAGRVDIVERLIAWGADVDALDHPPAEGARGDTALAKACRGGRWADTEAAALALLAAGADVTRLDFYDMTPLHHAAGTGSPRLVEALIAAGADPDARDPRFGRIPLHDAAEDGNAAAIPRLIAAGATVDAVSQAGETPLLEAVAHGRTGAARALLAAGADAAFADPRGRTPLHFAARHGDDDIVRLLADAGADLHAADDLGQSPFRILAAFGAVDLLKALRPRDMRRKPRLSEAERVAILVTVILQNTTGCEEYLDASFIAVLHERDRWIVPRGRRLGAAVSALGVGEAADGVVPCSLLAAVHHIFWYVDLRTWCHRDPNDGSTIEGLDDDTLHDLHEAFAMALGPYLTRRGGIRGGLTVERLTREELAARTISLSRLG